MARKDPQRIAASGVASLFETGTDPFGRPVAWATEERTGVPMELFGGEGQAPDVPGGRNAAAAAKLDAIVAAATADLLR